MLEPSFLARHPAGAHLYAVGERREGVIRAFAIDASDGSLSVVNDASSGGAGPCFISLHPTGSHAFIANYAAGSSAVVKVLPDGRLGAVTAQFDYEGSGLHEERQEASHAHAAQLDPSGNFVLVCDLGADRVWIHRFHQDGDRTEPAERSHFLAKPGSGPRHIAFGADGKYAYIANELCNTVSVCEWDSTRGELSEMQTVNTLPVDFSDQNKSAEIALDATGRFLYVSNRGHDSIATFAVEPDTGVLSLLGRDSTGGAVPRHFAIDPSGRWMLIANTGSNEIRVLKRDPEDGSLELTDHRTSLPEPSCLVFA